ncbi:MAG TPA: contact-dependent growth inhibition system immunity protein [Longimicrobium sp.]|nr:contact-dependent growth inhibition system immunity protein [Longimicrobium sp.]
MISIESYPALAQFFGGYFHQDWDMEAANWEGVVRNFCAAAQPEQIAAVNTEIEALLAGAHDERELSEFVFLQLGCAYDPTVDGIALRNWIMDIRQHL